jgi:hypothetical protein
LINIHNYFRSVTDLEDYAYYLSRVILFAPLLMATMLSSIILSKMARILKESSAEGVFTQLSNDKESL